MRSQRVVGHRHTWAEELRELYKNETRVHFFCPDCKGRKVERFKVKPN